MDVANIHCAGKAGCPVELAVTEARTFYFLVAYEAAGAGRHPAFPAPSDFRAREEKSKPRAHRAAGRFLLFERM
jgi:hypothetical protein